jgi:hypothetical protein
MGEFTTSTGEDKCSKEREMSTFGTGIEKETGYPTDVEGIMSDDVIKKGIEEFPVFNVSKEEFFSNMKADRKRIRFKSDSKVRSYIQKTKNGRPLYIKTKDSNGQEYVRKLK